MSTREEVKIEGFRIGSVTYRGSSSQIFKGNEIGTGRSVAIKTPVTLLPTNKQLQRYRRDFDLGREINQFTFGKERESSFFLQYLELRKFGHGTATIMDYFESSSLKERIPDHGMDLRTFLRVALLMVDALSVLHSRNICHKNINPTNFLIQIQPTTPETTSSSSSSLSSSFGTSSSSSTAPSSPSSCSSPSSSCSSSTSTASVPTPSSSSSPTCDCFACNSSSSSSSSSSFPLFFEDGTHVHLKLIDFSHSSRFQTQTQGFVGAGTFNLNLTHLSYISPEETGRMNRNIDYRCDFYSLGCTFYEMLTGRRPFYSSSSSSSSSASSSNSSSRSSSVSTSNDILELIHAHIALEPKAIHLFRPEIPDCFVSIVDVLMLKNAEARYQSCSGLKANLLEIVRWFDKILASIPTPPVAVVGNRTISGRFIVHNKLYGRDREVTQLMKAFNDVTSGPLHSSRSQRFLVLVSGYSGTGKTSLINEVHKPLSREKGYFISGKLDQYQKNGTPYLAFSQAFQQLVEQLLTESDDRLSYWKTSLLEAVEGNGNVIIDMVPDLELVIGPQPSISELSGKENESRFNYVLLRFLRVFAKRAHPLVLFLDDLQWAGTGTINLIDLILNDELLESLVIIGAFRDNEAMNLGGEEHPVFKAVRKYENKPNQALILKLRDLELTDIIDILRDSFSDRVNEAELEALAKLLKEKTNGNPLFVKVFLSSCYQQGFFRFENNSWFCDLKGIKAIETSENVVELIATRINQLPEETKRALAVASLLGTKFELGILSLCLELDMYSTFNQLRIALQQELILGEDEKCESIDESTERTQLIFLRFIHDRVQQAAYSLIEERERALLHFKLAKLLLRHFDESSELDSKFFFIVGLFNKGLTEVESEEDKLVVANLNLKAALAAMTATAYETCKRYVETATTTVTSSLLLENPQLGYELKRLEAECAYLQGHFDSADQLYPEVLKLGRIPSERIQVYFMMADQYELQGRYPEVLEAFHLGLKELDWKFPEDEGEIKKSIEEEMVIMKQTLEGKEGHILDLINAPSIKNPAGIMTLRLLFGFWKSTYILGKSSLSALVSARMSNYSLQHGNSDYAALGYLTTSFFTGFFPAMKRYFEPSTTSDFRELGLRMTESSTNIALKGKSYFIYSVFINKPLRLSFEYMFKAFDWSLQGGDLLMACYSASVIGTEYFYAGVELSEVVQIQKKYSGFLKSTARDIHLFTLAAAQAIPELMATPPEFEETAYIEQFKDMPLFMAIYYIGKVTTMFFFRRYQTDLLPIECQNRRQEEEDNIEETKEDGDVEMRDHSSSSDWLTIVDNAFTMGPVYLIGTMKGLQGPFYSALIYLDTYFTLSQAQQKRAREVIEQAIELFTSFSNSCESNFEHKRLLLEAERARINNEFQRAVDSYEEAISSARHFEMIHIEAIACEQYARFWITQPKPREKFARIYFQEAIYLYERWGATAKVEHMKFCYGNFLGAMVNYPISTHSSGTGIGGMGMGKDGCLVEMEVTDTADCCREVIEVIKAAQAISLEDEGERYLEGKGSEDEVVEATKKYVLQMLRMVLENTGARRVAFFGMEGKRRRDWAEIKDGEQGGEGTLKLRVEGGIDTLHFYFNKDSSSSSSSSCTSTSTSTSNSSSSQNTDIELSEWETGPQSIVHFVKRTKKNVLLGNALSDVQFGSDRYVLQTQSKSILCVPVILRNRLRGVIYLENSLTFFAFTRRKIEILELLLGQMAITLENNPVFFSATTGRKRTQT